MKPTYLILLTISILLITTSLLLAQPGLPSAPSQAPIDGGLGLLAAAGGAYALKKLRNKKNKGEEETSL
ncbi:MAG: PID-CTERM protein-sorting domain-containing protein [Balneola sp.]